jgi:Fe-Mn family superoxide dismutase
MDRRNFVLKTGVAVLGLTAAPGLVSGKTSESAAAHGHFELPKLGYAYNALEPHLDAQTMEIHYSKHHAGYVTNLNNALHDHPMGSLSLNDILKNLTPEAANTAVRNNAGGHFNHSLFWKILTPGGANRPSGAVAEAINAQFGSYEEFANQFGTAATKVFGSGWVWLSLDAESKLFISTTPNQDNPVMAKIVEKPGRPVLGLDVWEHAYYLKFQNRRKEYIDAFMGLINWDSVGANMANWR